MIVTAVLLQGRWLAPLATTDSKDLGTFVRFGNRNLASKTRPTQVLANLHTLTSSSIRGFCAATVLRVNALCLLLLWTLNRLMS